MGYFRALFAKAAGIPCRSSAYAIHNSSLNSSRRYFHTSRPLFNFGANLTKHLYNVMVSNPLRVLGSWNTSSVLTMRLYFQFMLFYNFYTPQLFLNVPLRMYTSFGLTAVLY